MDIVSAYSSPAKDIMIQSTSQTYTLNLANSGTEQSQTITIMEDGIIGGFLASGNLTAWSGDTGGAWTVRFRVYRNGQVISEGTSDLYEPLGLNVKGGTLYNEGLQFLAGTEVKKGETFTLGTWHNCASTLVLTVDSIMNITYKPIGRSFTVPVF